MLDQAFANLAAGCAATMGAPFVDAVAKWPGEPVKDAGGSIVTPAAPVERACKAQFDAATEQMRQAEGFLENDVRVLVLSATLEGALDTDATIIIASGRWAGTWTLLSCQRDPAGIGYECRARRV